jgi:DNA replication and repair protein RecF
VDQRNAALRRARAGLAGSDTVEPWDDRVVESGHALSEARSMAIAALGEPFSVCAADLGLDGAGLAYDPSPVTGDALAARFSADLERGLTGIGPHHDEMRITAGARELRSHGSQGEQRVAVLSLLLAEGELLVARSGAAPLLLLDDVLSELDGDRRAALVGRIRSASQVLVTTAARGALPGDPDQLLEVSPGRVRVA